MHSRHIANHIKNHNLRSDSTLHVIGVISNPMRYSSRYRLYREWEAAMLDTPNVQLHTVEAAFGDRHHEITSDGKDNNLQLRTKSSIWIKENMINLGVRELLPRDWKYMAWVDCDVFFRDKNWALETIHALQHYAVVQPWVNCMDLGPQGNVMSTYESFGSVHQKRFLKRANFDPNYKYGHTGFAWACRRDFWENTKGLMDFAILGSGDHHSAWAMIGEVEESIHKGCTPGYQKLCKEWQQRAIRVTKKEVGFVNGRIEHQFHGSKKNRFYQSRWQILINNKYDPEKDLMYDSQGMIQLIGKPELNHEIYKYNNSRNEDGTEE